MAASGQVGSRLLAFLGAADASPKELRAKYAAETGRALDSALGAAEEDEQYIQMMRPVAITHKEVSTYIEPTESEVDRWFQKGALEMSKSDLKSIQQCRDEAEVLSTGLFKIWKALNSIVICYESLIRKRWSAMSRVRKEQLLLEAWPEMSARHRPDLERLMDPGFCKSLIENEGSGKLQEMLWPCINLEDLLQSNALLMFLNSRARSQPCIFAHSDLEQAPLANLSREFLALREDHATMAFVGRDTAETYGEIILWNDAASAQDSIKSGRMMHVDNGLQILRIQVGIWHFLARFTGIILKETFAANKDAAVPTPQPEPPLLTMNKDPFMSRYIISRALPYSVPFKVDWDHIHSLVKSQKDHAMDHVISLTEDPSYFAEVTARFRDHRMELLLDLAGQPHPHAKDFPLYNKVQHQMTSDAHCGLFIWHEILQRIAKLKHISREHAPGISMDEDLPPVYFEALVEARSFLERISIDLIDLINAQIKSSPPLRKYYYRANPKELNLGITKVEAHPHIDKEDQLLQHVLKLFRLFKNQGLSDMLDLHVVLDEFERLLHDEARAKDLISPHTMSSISQLSVILECLTQLHRLQPWATKVESTVANDKAQYELHYDKLFYHWGRIHRAHVHFNTPKVFKVGNPEDGKFSYPAEQRRTRETVKAMISTENALQAFWKTANAHWLRHAGTTPAALVKHIIGERVRHRTQPWVEPTKSPSYHGLSSDALPGVVTFFGHYHDISKQITGNFNRLVIAEKDKKKTRGQAIGGVDKSAVLVATDDASVMRTIPVDKRARKAFDSLFHTPDSPDQPGQVAWRHFLHAMAQAGFGAEKLQGSAWHFTPQNKDIDRSIQFHEPHPSDKLPFTWARRYGRRLTRAFGWNRETFTLA